MFNKREILGGITYIALITILSIVLYSSEFLGTIPILFLSGFLCCVGFFAWNYLHIKKLRDLSNFLKRAQFEFMPLEVNDQQEGEFAILKSEIYKIVTRLYGQAELLEKEKKYLVDTISDISHQLKTPMTSMYVMLDLLKDNNLPQGKRMDFIRTIHSQMLRMEWLLSSMLTMSKLDAGTIVLKKEMVSTDKMLEKSLEHLLIPMELHGQTIQWKGERGTTYTGDFSWSCEALSNILKNCMEHLNEQGSIFIKTCQNPVYTEIQIIDNGCGIHADDLPHIFERFYRGKHASKDSVGIGLALADKLISLQNGKIDVDSVYGESTTFTIKFYHSNI